MIRKLYHLILPEKSRVRIKYLQFSIRGLFYKGNNVYCNCCDQSFSRFLPFGERFRREFAACPSCNSLERTRQLWFYLSNDAKVESTSLKILHFAPEKPIEKKLKELPNITYTSADINLAYADVKVDITQMQFNDNDFDLVICSHVLAHVEDEIKALNELYRVLKPGAKALILTNIFNQPHTFEDKAAVTKEQKLKVFGQDDLARMHGHDFKDRLRNSGFNVIESNHANSLSLKESEKYGISRDEVIFVAQK